MKKIMFLIIFSFVFSIKSFVYASTYGDMLISESMIQITNEHLHFTKAIRIMPNTTYTIAVSHELAGRASHTLSSYPIIITEPILNEKIIFEDSSNCIIDSNGGYDLYTFTTKNNWYYTSIGDIGIDYDFQYPRIEEFVFYQGNGNDFLGFGRYIYKPQYYNAENNATYVYFADPKYPITIDEILDKIKVLDNVDGSITNQITIIQNNYTNNSNIIGDHLVKLKIVDKAKNESFLNIIIRVIDVNVPVINGPDQITLKLSDGSKQEQELLSLYSAQDNYDGDLTEKLIVIENTYKRFVENNEKNIINNIGNYIFTIQVKDSSNNITTKVVNVYVKDDIAPTITGPSLIELEEGAALLSDEEIKTKFSVADNQDSTVRLDIINNNYKENHPAVGEFLITLKASDLSGNHTIINVIVKVKDVTKPIFYVDEILIPISVADQLTVEQIKVLLTAQLRTKGITASNIDINFNNYIGNESIEGEYVLRLSYLNQEGEVKYLQVKLQNNQSIEGEIQETYQKAGYILGGVFLLTIAGIIFFTRKSREN